MIQVNSQPDAVDVARGLVPGRPVCLQLRSAEGSDVWVWLTPDQAKHLEDALALIRAVEVPS